MAVQADRPVHSEVANPIQAGSSGKRLRGRRLKLARLAWVSSVLLAVGLFVIALPLRQAELLQIMQNLSPSQELVLRDLGVSGQQHAGAVLLVEVLVPLVFFAVSILVYWQRSDDWVAMLVSAGLVYYVSWVSPALDTLRGFAGWRIPAAAVQTMGLTCTLIFFYVFPDGRIVPQRFRLLLPLWGLFALAWVFVHGSVFDLSPQFDMSLESFGILIAWLATGYGAQIYRYMRVDTPVQRQQTKLVLFGAFLALLSYVTFGFNRFAIPVLSQPLFAGVVYDLIGVPIFMISVVVIPASFAVSILRYRLWDADVVINRAIVYGTLTAVLAGLYTASITLSQRVFVALTGEKSDAAIVFTTLVVASAFTHAKGILQSFVDRYLKPMPDPIKEIQAFSGQMRSFVEMMDVESLACKVCQEAVRAFDATGGAVYLMDDGHFRNTCTHGDWAQIEGMSVWLEADGRRFGWIALGPRRNQAEYEQGDVAIFSEMGSLAARAMVLVEGASFEKHSDRGARSVNSVGR